MRRRLTVCAGILLLMATPAYAHRLDEYLQATTILVGSDRVRLQLRLTPGVAVLRSVLAEIDGNTDGTISADEQRAYVSRVLRDISLSVDGTPLAVAVTNATFGTLDEMREGRGEIAIDLVAAIPLGGTDRRLTFENRHQRAVSVFMVNALVPRDPAVRIARQLRSYEQTSYELDYALAGIEVANATPWWRGTSGWLVVIALLSMAQLAYSARGVARSAPVEAKR